MGHARPDAVPLSVLRQSRLDPDHAERQAADALRPDRPALVQPQHQAAGAPQHLRALRHRQRLLFGLARSEHDLFLGAVRGRHRGSDRGAEQQIPPACRSDRPAARPEAAGDRLRLGRLCRIRRQDLWREGGRADHQQGAARFRAGRIHEGRPCRQGRNPAAGLSRRARPLRPHRLDRDDRGGRRAVLAEIFLTVARPAAAGRPRRHSGHHHPGQPVPDLPARSRLHPALRFPRRHAALAAGAEIARRAVRRSRHPRAHFRARLCQDARDLAK